MMIPLADATFDLFAEDYEACCARGLALAGESKEYFARRRVEWLVQWLEDREVAGPRRIIDFGCGVGDVSVLLSDRFPSAEVIGVDASAACVERARRDRGETGRFSPRTRNDRAFVSVVPGPCHPTENPSVRFELVEEYTAAAGEPADLLHCSGVLHHVPARERPRVVVQMVSLVRPGGWVYVFENNPWNPGTHWVMRRIPFDRGAKMLTPATTRRLLRRCGVEVCETVFLFFFPRVLRGLRVLERALRHVPFGAQYGIVGRRSGG